MHILLIIFGIVLLALLLWYLYRKYILKESTILHLPLRELGFENVPAFPIILSEVVITLGNLLIRSREIIQAKSGLTPIYTIKEFTANAYSFAFGKGDSNTKEESMNDLLKEVKISSEALYKNSSYVKNKLQQEGVMYKTLGSESLTALSLDHPDQFSLSWTTFGNVHRNATNNLLPLWSKTLTDAKVATAQFFPIIAQYGSAYNLLFLQKVNAENVAKYKTDFSDIWTVEMDRHYESGSLYIIDLRIYSMLEAQQSEGFDRFTPSTFTWLLQDKDTKDITPFAIHVSGYNGSNAQFYDYSKAQDSAWLYALQAVKVSVTVYGIWIGHVYHWHLVTASMIMTMLNNLSDNHAVKRIIEPQSKHIIGFNDVLVLLWKKAAPPTSIITAHQFLSLIDVFADGRQFFEDDPTTTIENLGLNEADFTVITPWDRYPIVGYLLNIWNIVEEYATSYVENTYITDDDVVNDTELQNWIVAAGQNDEGNIKGLPPMISKAALIQVLTSLLYRITAHGISRVDNTANPGMTFVGNFPPCLQSTHIPDQSSSFSTEELMEYLPNTGTIGEMITFYYTFVDSAPYEPIIPLTGVDQQLFFDNGIEGKNNMALIKFRESIVDFIKRYTESNKIPNLPANEAQLHQWPMGIET